jgi:hypothetical protein
VVGQIGQDNVKAFWLAGHSQGGMTSNRIIRTDFFKDKVDGWISLSGGRLGANPTRQLRRDGRRRQARPVVRAAALAALAPVPRRRRPACRPTISPSSTKRDSGRWTRKDCRTHRRGRSASAAARGARRTAIEIADTKAGYVYDGSRQNPPVPAWGLLPGPGKARVFVYPDCREGRVVADVVRVDKGHTEGLEPAVSEEIVKLMVSSTGGRIARMP